MPGWDEDSPQLESNLADAQRLATEHALARRRLTLSNIKAWHRATMKGLEAEEADELDTLDIDGLRAVAEAAAWAHCEWVHIHPFANGKGRTSRLIGNTILVRYGLPPVFRLRPRPGGDYAHAAAAARRGDHLPMTAYVIDELRARAKQAKP